MSRPDPATRVSLPELYAADLQRWEGRKVRTVGILTAADPASAVGVLAFQRAAIVLDLSLCMEEGNFLPRLKTKLDCIGDVERVDVEAAMIANSLLDAHVAAIPRPAPRVGGPSTSSQAPDHGPSEIAPLVLRCIHFRNVDDLDLRAWNDAAEVLQSHIPAGQGS
ncbi:unnamed protein product [Tilletia controversa]|uniref:Uncharacterized protein n=3 Tax=Tilletia TaxID=13289 RepID=A0A8X7SZ06_9BASI|nr:hypothetical protein CF336_g1764 [Tilletia laevis]KAE8203325.1 hypothetical protein CF328_g1722 [Tilletia controversa]KAE8263975.1 hypothetical protein A4X03_0g1286 [Tilletia caries]KAE8252426.1 hypothetical protein A4X06_0g2191 [Tilletia controversa]CAD6888081.1 unnamed protein product [Tilletia caries]